MTLGRVALFVASVLVALVLFAPLSVALSVAGVGNPLTARSATGTIWSGRLAEARIGGFDVGDAEVGLRPLSLLTGPPRISVRSAAGRADLVSSGPSAAIIDATAKLKIAGRFAPIPIDALELTDVSATFSNGRCARAQGRVRATIAGEVGGLSLAQGMSGSVRCGGDAALISLTSASTMERLLLRIDGAGAYRAELYVRSVDPVLATRLLAAGFIAAPGGFVQRATGKL